VSMTKKNNFGENVFGFSVSDEILKFAIFHEK
jgi:hypothetical protein